MHTADVLTPQASEFLVLLQREFGDEREELLAGARPAPRGCAPGSCRTSSTTR